MADVGLTKEQVIAVCPALGGSALTPDEWTSLLEVTQAQLNPNFNGLGSVTKANIVGRYLAAHLGLRVVQSKSAGAGGAAGGGFGSLSSVQVGGVSKTYRTPGVVDTVSLSQADFLGTVPGREYLRLVQLWSGRVVAV